MLHWRSARRRPYVQEIYALFVTIALSNVAGCRAPLAAATVEDNFLGMLGFLEPKLLLECLRAQLKGIGQDGEGNVDGGWDRALGDLIRFSNIDEEGILSNRLEPGGWKLIRNRHTAVGFWVFGRISS